MQSRRSDILVKLSSRLLRESLRRALLEKVGEVTAFRAAMPSTPNAQTQSMARAGLPKPARLPSTGVDGTASRVKTPSASKPALIKPVKVKPPQVSTGGMLRPGKNVVT